MTIFFGAPPAVVDNRSVKTNGSGQVATNPVEAASQTPVNTSTTSADELMYEIALPTGLDANSVFRLFTSTANSAKTAAVLKIKVFDGATETLIATTSTITTGQFVAFVFNIWSEAAGGVFTIIENYITAPALAKTYTASINVSTLTKLRIYGNITTGVIDLQGYKLQIARKV